MKQIPVIHFVATLLAFAASVSCNKDEEVFQPFSLKSLPSEARQNNLAQLPGVVYRHAAASAIHWQPWTPESLQVAQASNRMIFAVVVMAQVPGFAESLNALSEDPSLVSQIHAMYVPILIDGDAAREIGMLTADLSQEINQNLQLPFFIWMSPEGNPVAWISSPWVDAESTRDHFRHSHSMVAKIWEESPEYVVKNSTSDNQSRFDRISRRRLSRIASEQSKLDTARSIRQLASLYDPLSRNYDDIGGLFPVGALDLLASAAMQPGLPEDARRRAEETTREFMKDLLGSAMFDPLDGGLFSARRGNSWSLPRHSRHSIMQSRAAVALFRAHQATGDLLALERALGLLNFAEKNFQTSDGLFAIGSSSPIDSHLWLWTIDDVESILGPEEGKWWASITNMRSLGNLAYEIDPGRLFFRSNSLELKKPLTDLARAENMPLAAFTERFEAAREKLLAVREARLGETTRDDSSHAVATFRMASAYAAAFTATGDDPWRRKAAELLERSRQAFAEGTRLRVYSADSPPSINDARAFVYAVAIQAILDVVDVTSDVKWLDWCDDLATTMTETFTQDGFLREVAEESSVLQLPMTDLIMLFEDSTVGLLNFAECRLTARNRPLMPDLREFAGTLPVSAVDFPIQHTDIVQAFLARHYAVTVVYGPDTSRELMDTVERLPIRMFHRRPVMAAETLPAGGGLVIHADVPEPIEVSTPQDLKNALLPNAARQ